MLSSAFRKGQFFLYQAIQSIVSGKLAQASFLGDQEIFASCKSSSHHLNGWVPTGSAKVFFQETPAGYRTLAACQNDTSLKSPDGLKDAECKKGQLSHQPPIPYIPVVDIVMPKEETQLFKVKLPDVTHLSMPIYSRGNNKEYRVQIVAILCIIEQKG